jgi:hypothetical protein
MLKIVLSIIFSFAFIIAMHYAYNYIRDTYFDDHVIIEEDVDPDEELKEEIENLENLDDDDDDNSQVTELFIEDNEQERMEKELTNKLNNNLQSFQ